MRELYSVTLSVVLGLLTLNGAAYAHGTEKYVKMVPVDAQMKKLHAMMPLFSIASAELESALEKGDRTAAKAQADKIMAAIPDLKKSKPHKNIKQRKKFVELAASLDETITYTAEFIKNDDLSGAKTAFKKIEGICAACHATFRD